MKQRGDNGPRGRGCASAQSPVWGQFGTTLLFLSVDLVPGLSLWIKQPGVAPCRTQHTSWVQNIHNSPKQGLAWVHLWRSHLAKCSLAQCRCSRIAGPTFPVNQTQHSEQELHCIIRAGEMSRSSYLRDANLSRADYLFFVWRRLVNTDWSPWQRNDGGRTE